MGKGRPNHKTPVRGNDDGTGTGIGAGAGGVTRYMNVERILQEFLEDCLPDGVGGVRRWGIWDGKEDGDWIGDELGDNDKSIEEEEEEMEMEMENEIGWEGLERNRRVSGILARCLREGGYI